MSSLRVRRIEGAPIVAVRAALAGGARIESVPGLALVSGRMLAEGSRRHSWRELAELAEALGMTTVSYGGLEAHGVAVDALVSDWRAALELVAELLFEPAFPLERLRWVARQAAGELESQADQADLLTAREFADLLYSPHPKGRPLQGSADSLATIEPDSCRAFHASALANGIDVAIAGAIDEEEVAAEAERLLGLPAQRAALAAWEGPSADRATPRSHSEISPPDPPGRSARRRDLVTCATDQAHLFLGHLTVARADPDYEALELGGVILGAGAGLSGRIPQRIRDTEGLAYSASADIVSWAGSDPGRLVVYVGTAEENVGRAERAAREELERLVDGGVLPVEVEEACSYLIGREPFRRETARQWCDLTLAATRLGLPIDDAEWRIQRLLAVDRDAVEGALRRHLDPAALAVTIGHPRPG